MKVKPRRKPIKWPNGARIAITPCVAFETWPEDLGGPNTLQQENRRSFPRNAVTKRNLAIITDREFGERVGIYRMLERFRAGKNSHDLFPDRHHGAKLSGDIQRNRRIRPRDRHRDVDARLQLHEATGEGKEGPAENR